MPALLLLTALFAVLPGCSSKNDQRTAQTSVATPSSLQDISLTQLDGAPLADDALQGKALLVVNVASKCGYTSQYEGLQALYEEMKDSGLEIVGVPCNQFAGQEPGSAEEIATFCRVNYGVDFTLLEKQDVNGGQRSPLYSWLVNSDVGAGQRIGWNFEKFVVDASGNVTARFGSSTRPDDPALRRALEAALPEKG